MKNTKFFTILLVSISMFLLVACGQKTTDSQVDTDLVTNNKTADNPNATNPEPIFTCAEPIWNFGKINEGEVVLHTFKFTNTGNEALVISNCQASCGCTTPKCSKNPVAPGESGEIEIRFASEGRTNNITKNITVTANTNPPETVLTITGFVIPSAD